VFRIAYAEHPDYVPLAHRAGALGDQLGAEEGATLLQRTGMLSIGEPDSGLITGTTSQCGGTRSDARLSVAARGTHELSDLQAAPGVECAVRASGRLDRCGPSLRAGLRQAAHSGAELYTNTRLEDWQWKGSAFELTTSDGTFSARHLVITAGAWSGRILKALNLPLTVVRKLLVWVQPERPEDFTPDVFPVFASGRCFFYGFPNIDDRGVKLAIHRTGGEPVADPDSGQLQPAREDIRPVLDAAAELLPSLAGEVPDAFSRVTLTKTCFYTTTPDEHFVIDRHPQVGNLVFAAGFSEQGFKFAPAIGEALVDITLRGTSSLPLEFLSLKRLRQTGT
jgi:sarcosine oxidase